MYRENSNTEIEIDGMVMSRYEWSQEQRRIETAVRAQKDIAIAAKASGDDFARREAQSKINALNEKHAKISNAAGLEAQKDRMRVAGFRQVKTVEQLKNPFSTLQSSTRNGILIVKETRKNHGKVNPKESPNAVIDVIGKKGGISRFIYDASGNAKYRVDNNDHGYPKEHDFKNGEHYHVAEWDDGKWIGFSAADEIPKQLRKLCADILKKGDNHV